MKLKNSPAFLFFILLTDLGLFFVWYFYKLNMRLSLLSFSFIFLFVLTITSSLYIWKNKIWSVINIFLIFILFLYSLANYLYLEVFKNFLHFSSNSGFSFVNLTQTVREYFDIVPFSIYLLSLISFLIASYSIIIFVLKKEETLFLNSFFKKNFLLEYRGILALGIFSLSLVYSFFLVAFFKANPRESWWQEKNLISDYGILGVLYNDFYGFVDRSFHEDTIVLAMENIKKLQNVKSKEINSNKELKESKKEIKNFFDLITFYSDKLALKKDNDIAVKVPTLDNTNTPNILIYQLESVALWPTKFVPNPMPYLTKMIDENISVDNFIANDCHTIDAEFATLCSLYTYSSVPISAKTQNNDHYCLPSVLKDRFGFKTSVFHSNVIEFWERDVLMPKWGVDNLYFYPDEIPSIKYNDHLVLGKAIDEMSKSSDPSFSYIIGYTSHAVHDKELVNWLLEEYPDVTERYHWNLGLGKDMKIFQTLDVEEEFVENYLTVLTNIDNSIKYMFEKLEKENLLDNTIVVVMADHRYYGFAEDNLENFWDFNKLPFFIYVPKGYKLKAQDFASHIDIAPTLLNLLEGKNYNKPKNFIGQSLFDENNPNQVMLKCENQINYVNNDVVIKGNYTNKQYGFLKSPNTLSEYEKSLYKKNLDMLVNLSDSIIDNNQLVTGE